MDQELLDRKKVELQQNYPHMFGHPQAQEGEIFLGGHVIDVAGPQAHTYRNAGLTSTRLGETYKGTLKGKKGKFDFKPIFANLEEFIKVAEQ